MRIKEIRLIDFTTHRDTRLEFTEGINLITGPNGSGKSSVIQAIYFALFGRGLYYGRKESLVRHGSKNLLVEVGLDGDRLKFIRRTLRGVETTGINLNSSTALKEYLFRFYNLSPNRFLNTLLIKQGETTSFLDRSPRERLKVYESIMGVDTLRAISDAASELQKRYRGMLREMDVETISGEMDALEKELEALRVEVENVKKELSSAITRRRKIEEKLSAVEGDLKRLDELERQLLLLRKKKEDLRRLQRELRELESYLSENRELYESYLEMENLRELALRKIQMERDIIALEKRVKELSRLEEEARLYEKYLKYAQDEVIMKMEGILSESSQLVNKINSVLGTGFTRAPELLSHAGKIMENLEKEYERAREKLNRLLSSRGMLKSAIDERKRAIETLSDSSGGTCPVCGRPLTKEHREEILVKYRKEVEELKSELSRVNEEISHLEKDIKRLEKALQIRPLLDKLEEYTSWMTSNREKWKEWKEIRRHARYRDSYEKYRELLGTRDEMERKKKVLEQMKEIDAHEILGFLEKNRELYREYSHRLKLREKILGEVEGMESERMEETIAKLQEEINSINRKALEEELILLRKELERAISVISSLKTRISSMEELMEEKEKRLKDLRKIYDRAMELEDRIHYFQDMVQRISVLIDRLKTLHDRNLRILTWNYFRDFELESYNSLYFETTSSGMDIYATTHSGNRVYVQSMSGGERVALSLSIRMAIARILDIRFRTIIMDEPTAGLDRDRVNKLGEILQNFVKMNPGSQIILITHEESLAEYANKRFRFNKIGEETFIEEF